MLPYAILAVHAVGIVAATLAGWMLLVGGDPCCAGIGGALMLLAHTLGVFHGLSFPQCPPAQRLLFWAAIAETAISAAILLLLGVFIAFPGSPALLAAGVGLGIAPAAQHLLQWSAFVRSRKLNQAWIVTDTISRIAAEVPDPLEPR